MHFCLHRDGPPGRKCEASTAILAQNPCPKISVKNYALYKIARCCLLLRQRINVLRGIDNRHTTDLANLTTDANRPPVKRLIRFTQHLRFLLARRTDEIVHRRFTRPRIPTARGQRITLRRPAAASTALPNFICSPLNRQTSPSSNSAARSRALAEPQSRLDGNANPELNVSFRVNITAQHTPVVIVLCLFGLQPSRR